MVQRLEAESGDTRRRRASGSARTRPGGESQDVAPDHRVAAPWAPRSGGGVWLRLTPGAARGVSCEAVGVASAVRGAFILSFFMKHEIQRPIARGQKVLTKWGWHGRPRTA